MGLLNRIFNRNDQTDILSPDRFGRYSDAFKSEDRYRHWDRAIRSFDSGEFRNALIEFLSYLRNQEEDNIHIKENSRNLEFSIIQGSKKIKGQFVNDLLVVHAHLVSGTTYPTGLMRRLLEKNYQLNYCRYALSEKNELTLIFDSFIRDANPYKLYFGLKELALQADKIDDLILIEFNQLAAFQEDHLRSISDSIIDAKTNFYYKKISALKAQLDNGYLKKIRDTNSIIYAVLATFYELDFLLTPHGKSTEIIERAHKSYFADSTRHEELKISDLLSEVEKLYQIAPENLKKEWYGVIYTFGINSPVDLRQVQSTIATEIKKVDWYIENNQFDEARAITGFIIGYILFDYAIDYLLKSLLLLYYRILNQDFFNSMGIQSNFINNKGSLNKSKIESEIERIIDFYSSEYHIVKIPVDDLQYQSIYHFGQSLLHLIQNSSFTPIEDHR